jgi:hypothetical protein
MRLMSFWRRSAPASRAPRLRCRLRLEALESRLAPAVVEVGPGPQLLPVAFAEPSATGSS